jgi:asparaginyl-tRNA synthetase
MSTIKIANIKEHHGKPVTLAGWLYNKRSSGKLQFLQLRDGSDTIQCVVVKNEVDEATFALAEKLTQESSLTVTGTVREDKRSRLGFEIGVQKIELIQLSEEFPISKKEHGTSFLMDHRHLWLRSSKQHAIIRVRARVAKAIRDFLDSHGFINVDTPIFTPAACEGTTTLFETNYFDKKAYLTQSGQLYNEANAMAHGKVYCFGPTFRAEKSKTRRHLTEFWMVEPEMAYVEHEENMTTAEALVEYVVQTIAHECKNELMTLERDTSKLTRIKAPFPRITYDEAAQILIKKGLPFQYGSDFGAEDEVKLMEDYDQPLFVHKWPKEIKAFYMKADRQNPQLVLGMDLLAPEGYGEIVGGSQREDNYEILLSKIRQHNLPLEAFEWYLDLRRYGSCPHSGFGLGLERTVTWICGIHHLRETIAFPRMLERLTP